MISIQIDIPSKTQQEQKEFDEMTYVQILINDNPSPEANYNPATNTNNDIPLMKLNFQVKTIKVNKAFILRKK